MKIIKQLKGSRIADNGKTYPYTNYYLELDNGVRVAIRPAFKDGYQTLDVVCSQVEDLTEKF